MKTMLQQQNALKKLLYILPALLMIFIFTGCRKNPLDLHPTVTTLTTDLQGPMGIETDRQGNIWVAETGTAHNDGKVVLIRHGNHGHSDNVKVYDAIINLSSIKNALSDEVEGPAGLLLDHGWLYILAGDFLYTVDLSSVKRDDLPIDGSQLPYEDIGSWVRSQNIVTPNDSHPYDLIKGPHGNIFIVDAGANALIKREGKGKYSVFATFPNFPNPTPVGPPMVQSVPTGIIFDGRGFLVSCLTGFPFPEGHAMVYRVAMDGDVSVYQDGFTTLVDIAPGNFYGQALLHFGAFGPTGFMPNTGALLMANGHSKRVIVDELNMPSGLKQIGYRSWLVTSLGDGSLMKISYGYH